MSNSTARARSGKCHAAFQPIEIDSAAASWLYGQHRLPSIVAQSSSLPSKPDASARDSHLRESPDPAAIITRLYLTALSRPPTSDEQSTALNLLSEKPTSENLQDLLWSVIMLPEFQLIR